MSYIHNRRALPTSLAVIALHEYLDMDPVNSTEVSLAVDPATLVFRLSLEHHIIMQNLAHRQHLSILLYSHLSVSFYQSVHSY